MKRALYRQMTEELAAAGIRSEDVLIVLNENERADWSAGNREAQLLDMVPSAAPGTAAAVGPSAEEMWARSDENQRRARVED